MLSFRLSKVDTLTQAQSTLRCQQVTEGKIARHRAGLLCTHSNNRASGIGITVGRTTCGNIIA